jgi:hypothetical protein
MADHAADHAGGGSSGYDQLPHFEPIEFAGSFQLYFCALFSLADSLLALAKFLADPLNVEAPVIDLDRHEFDPQLDFPQFHHFVWLAVRS